MLRIYVAKRGIGAFEREGGQRATLRPDDFQRLGTAMAAARGDIMQSYAAQRYAHFSGKPAYKRETRRSHIQR